MHFVGDGITWSNVITGFQVVVVVHSVKRLGSSLYLYTLLDMMLIKTEKICSQVARSMALLYCERLVVFSSVYFGHSSTSLQVFVVVCCFFWLLF